MIDQEFSKNIDLFFASDVSRSAALSDAHHLDSKLMNFREFENSYNYNCIILFESKFSTNDSIPFTLDLHGFRSSSAERAIKDFVKFIEKHRLPTCRIIFGKGLVLVDVVKQCLDMSTIQELEWSQGHVDVYLKEADYSKWPIVNKKLRDNKDESLFWTCFICKTNLVVPKVPNKTLRSLCNKCEAEYLIKNEVVEIIKEFLKCESCLSEFKVPKTKKNLLITCPKCNQHQPKYSSHSRTGPKVDVSKKHHGNKPSQYSNYNSDSKNSNSFKNYSSKKYEYSSNNCFIATAVYKDRNAISVVLLRIYRNTYLSKFFFGRLFIKIYYLIAPYLVQPIAHNKEASNLIRKLLDSFLNKILIGKLYGYKNCS